MPKLNISPEDQALIAQLRAAGLDREAFDLEAAIARDQAASGRTMPLWGDPRFPAGADSRWQKIVEALAEYFLSAESVIWQDQIDDDVVSQLQNLAHAAKDMSKTEKRKFLLAKSLGVAKAAWEDSERDFSSIDSGVKRLIVNQLRTLLNGLFRQKSVDASFHYGVFSRAEEPDTARISFSCKGDERSIVNALRESGAWNIDVEESDGGRSDYTFNVEVDWSSLRDAIVGYAYEKANQEAEEMRL